MTALHDGPSVLGAVTVQGLARIQTTAHVVCMPMKTQRYELGEKLLERIDTDHDGKMSFPEFQVILTFCRTRPHGLTIIVTYCGYVCWCPLFARVKSREGRRPRCECGSRAHL